MKSQEYMVSLEIETESLSLQELVTLMGIEGDDNSISKGDEYDTEIAKRSAGASHSLTTVWIYESDVERKEDLELHFQSLKEEIDIPDICKADLPDDCDIRIRIGILYYSFVCGFNLPVEWMQFFAENNIRVSVSCYPCSSK